MIYIFGASGSGKSIYAEEIACQYPSPRIYLATMQIYDIESLKKVKKHREQRKGKGFITIEKENYIGEVQKDMEKDAVILLECLSNLLANTMFPKNQNSISKSEAIHQILNDIIQLNSYVKECIIVGNDVFDKKAYIKYNHTTMEYIYALEEIHKYLLEKADKVIELVFGCPIKR